MEHKTLTAADAEMMLVSRHDVEQYISSLEKIFDIADKFMKHKENRQNETEFSYLFTALNHNEIRMRVLQDMNLVTCEDGQNYGAKSRECAERLARWFCGQ